MSVATAQARLWAQKWRWYERNSLPWNRAQIHWQFMRREAFVRWPVHGNVLEALREGRLEVGAGVLLEPRVEVGVTGYLAADHVLVTVTIGDYAPASEINRARERYFF